jgi:hypothetical protein
LWITLRRRAAQALMDRYFGCGTAIGQ